MIALTGILLLTACGTDPGERAVSGAGIGAASGAILGAVTGMAVLQGALIGTGVGAAVGGLTKSDTVNLGDPVWKKFNTTPASQTSSASSAAASSAPQTSNMVAATQANLARLGYRPGPVDGRMGEKTSAAIRQYQQDNGLPVSGELNGQIAMDIEKKATGIPR
jgi:peptidoglycan hydrolase-like protein with peptidoglycan-binding domain